MDNITRMWVKELTEINVIEMEIEEARESIKTEKNTEKIEVLKEYIRILEARLNELK